MSEPTSDTRITLSTDQLERLEPFGAVEEAIAGTVLVEQGDREPDLIVVLAGAIEVFDIEPETRRETSVGVATPGMFMGELNVLSGETTFVRARDRPEYRAPDQRRRAPPPDGNGERSRRSDLWCPRRPTGLPPPI